MALTPEGTPYIESSDLVANYPSTSLSLANRVDLVGVLPFATSAARSTAIPSPTDGQYSYLQDTNSTEFWNGAAWQAAAIPPGLVLVEPTTIANSGGTATRTGGQVVYSGVTSVSLNGIFSGTYQNYITVFDLILAGGGDVSIRWRVAGTDATGSNYVSQWLRAIGATVAGSLSTSTLSNLSVTGGTNSVYTGTIYKPFEANPTQYTISSGSEAGISSLTSRHTLSTSYDGFTLLTSSGSFSGTVRVYGVKNS